MPFDEVSDHKEALTRHARAQVERVLAQRGLAQQIRLTAQRDAFGAGSSVETVDTFSTGYDGTDTVSVFILDYSALDGPDVLAT